MSAPRTLDVGCGNDKLPGAVGIDRSPHAAADVVHDLDVFPWPLPDAAFDRVRCQDVLEHLADVVRAMEEIHRVTTDGAEVRVRVPHFSSVQAYSDPTHRHVFSSAAFDVFDPDRTRYGYYTPARFRVVGRRLNLWKPYRWLGIGALANRFPDRYEKMFAFVFPCESVEFVLLRASAATLPRARVSE